MPRTSDARARFIRTAARLFQEKGYHGVGLTEIIAEANAPKGSFYHHFPEGKEELAEAAIRLAGDQVARMIDTAFAEAPDAQSGAGRLAAALADWFAGSGFRAGCPVTSIALETTPQSPRLHKAVEETMQGWIDRVATHLRRLGCAQPPAPEERALRFLIALEGGWIVARAFRSREPILQAAQALAPEPYAPTVIASKNTSP